MKFWYTDNIVSRTVAGAFKANGTDVDHISNWTPQPSIFYGIHRGCGNAMTICKAMGIDYYYLDNGYFDAEYVDRSGKKDLSGTYRIVKNGMHEKYGGKGIPLLPTTIIETVLLIPPSPYSAYFHNTTPEDWIQSVAEIHPKLKFTVRNKSAETDIESEIFRHNCVIAFNSMAVIKAVEMGKPVSDTHGVFQNKLLKYNYNDVKSYYAKKQYTLEQIANESMDWL